MNGTACTKGALIRLVAVFAAIASFCAPAVAADGDAAAVTILVPGGTAASPAVPETAPGGTVVLRGDHPAIASAGQPALARPRNQYQATGYGGSIPVLLPRAGWDRRYDTGGIDRSGFASAGADRQWDRNYDNTGTDWGFDRSGLSRP
jgi:hypothetical protein